MGFHGNSKRRSPLLYWDRKLQIFWGMFEACAPHFQQFQYLFTVELCVANSSFICSWAKCFLFSRNLKAESLGLGGMQSPSTSLTSRTAGRKCLQPQKSQLRCPRGCASSSTELLGLFCSTTGGCSQVHFEICTLNCATIFSHPSEMIAWSAQTHQEYCL